MARGAGHDLNGLGDQIIAKLEEIYNKEVQINNTTVAPKTDASGLESLDKTATRVYKNLQGLSNAKPKANLFTTLDDSANNLKKTWNNLVKDVAKGKLSEVDLYNPTTKTNPQGNAVLKAANVYEALGGNLEDLSNQQIANYVKTMRGNPANVTNQRFSVENLKEAFSIFKEGRALLKDPVFHENKRSGSIFYANEIEENFSSFQNYNEEVAKAVDHTLSLSDALKEANEKRAISAQTQRKRILTEKEILEEGGRLLEEEEKQAAQKQERREKAKQKALNKAKKKQTSKTVPVAEQTSESTPEETTSSEITPITTTAKTKKGTSGKKRVSKKVTDKTLEQTGAETVQDTQEAIVDAVQQGANDAVKETSSTNTAQWVKENYKSPDKNNFLIKPVREALQKDYELNRDKIIKATQGYLTKKDIWGDERLTTRANEIPKELKEQELRIAKKFQQYGKDNRSGYKTKTGESTKTAEEHMEDLESEIRRYTSQRATLDAMRQEISRREAKQAEERAKQAAAQTEQAKNETKKTEQGVAAAKIETKKAQERKANAEQRADTAKTEAKEAEKEAKQEERATTQTTSTKTTTPPSSSQRSSTSGSGGKGGNVKPPSYNWDEFTKIDKEEFDKVLAAYRISGHKNANDEIKEIRKNVSAKKDNVTTTYGVVDKQGNIVTGEMKRGVFVYDSKGQRTTSKYAPPKEQEQSKQAQANTSRDATNLKQVNNLLEKQKGLYAEIQQLKNKISIASTTGATQQETDRLKQELEMRQNFYNNNKQLIQDLKKDSSKETQKTMTQQEKEVAAFEKTYAQSQSAYQKGFETNYQRIQDAVAKATALDKKDPLLTQANQLMQKISDPKAMGFTENNGKELAKNIKAETDAIVKSLQDRNKALNAQNVGKNKDELLVQKDYLSQLGYGQLDEKSLKVDSNGTATLKFIQNLGDYAVTTTLKINDLNVALQQMQQGTYQDTLKTGQDIISMQAKEIKQSNDTYEKFMKPYIQARAKDSAGLVLTNAESSIIQQFDEKYANKDPNARAAINQQVLVNMANELSTALNKAWTKSGEKVDAYRAKLEEIRNLIEDLKTRGINLWDETSVTNATATFTQAQMGLRSANSKDYDFASPASISNLQNRMQKWASFNTKAMKNTEFSERYNYITETLEKGKLTSSVKDVRNLGVAFDQLSADVNKANMAGYSFGDMWKQRLTNFGTYLASYASMYRIWATIKQGISTVTELDTALTEMRKVSDESLTSLKQYQVESFNLANNVGTTALQIQNSTADWMRLGESMDEASKSAQASAVLMNVSEFQSIDEATTSLVSMSAAYSNMDKMDIIDKLNNIGNNFSISTDGIATALQNSASALTTANNDIDEAIALITAGNAVVQDPKKVGAGIRTIALRIQGTEQAKEELKSLGEDTEDYIVGTKSKINEQVKAFTAVASNEFKGVSLLDENGNYRSTYEILQDIADIYDEIQETDKKYGTNHEQGLIELLAGKNRSNIAASILQNGEMLRDVYESSQMSAGSAQEENEKYLDSVNGKMAQMKNEFQDLAFSALDSDSLKGLIEGATKFLDILNNIIKTLGSLPTVLSVAFAGFSASKGYNLIGKGDKSLTGSLVNYFTKKTYTQSGAETTFFKTLGATGNFTPENLDTEVTKTGSRNLNNWVLSLGQGDKQKGLSVLSQELSKTTDAAGQARTGLENLAEQEQSFNKYAMTATGGATKFQTALSGLKNVAATVGSTLLSMGVAMAASWAIGKGIQLISDIIHREEIAIEKGQEAQTALESASKAYKDINTTVTNLGKTYNESSKEISTSSEAIDSLTKKYYELRKGVDANTNKNISLSDEDYQSYLDISNQLAEAFPMIKSGTDEAGNAILNMGNNASTASSQLKELLETERAIANMEIEKNLITSFKGAKASVKQYQEDIDKKETEVSTKKKEVQNVDLSGVQKDISEDNYKIIQEIAGKYLAKENKSASTALAEATKTRVEYENKDQKWWAKTSSTYDYKNDIDFSKLKQQFDSEENWEAFVREAEGRLGKARKDTQTEISKTQSEIDSLTSKQKNDYNQQIENIKSLLQSDSTFAEANANLTQSIMNTLKDNESMTFEKLFGKDGKSGLTDKQIVDHIYDNIIDPLSELSKPAQDALVQALSLDTNTLSYSGYESQINTLLEKAFPENKTSQDAWKDRLGLDKMVESYEENFQAAKDKVKGLDEQLKNLSGEDLQLVAKMDTDESINTLSELKNKIQELRDAAEPPVPVTIEEAIKEEDSTFTAAQKAQESANSGATYDTMYSMYKTAKELVEKGDIGTDDFQKIAAMFSPSGAKDLENWNENLGKIKSYFTEDNSGLKNFLNDLKDKGFADFDEKLKSWTLNLGDMEKAAREMGIGYEPFLAILGELKDKGFTNDFFADAESGGQLLGDLTNQLYEAQKELDDLNTYDGNNKTAIKAKEEEIESLQERIESTTESLDELLNPKNVEELPEEINGARDRMQKRLSAFNKTSKKYTDGEGKQAMKTYGEAVVQALQKEGFVNAGLREGKNGAWKIDLDVNTKDFETKSKYKDVEKGGEKDRDYYNKYKDLMTEDERETYKRDWINKRQEGKGNKKKYKNAGENIEGNLVDNVVESNRDIVDTYVDLYKSGKDYSGQQEKLKKIADEQGKSINDLIRDYGSAGKLEEYQQAYLNDPETQQLSEGLQYDTSTIEGATNSNTDALNANTAALEANTQGNENNDGKDKERDSNRRLPENNSNKPSSKEQRVREEYKNREEKKKQNRETAEGHDKHFVTPPSKQEERTNARREYGINAEKDRIEKLFTEFKNGNKDAYAELVKEAESRNITSDKFMGSVEKLANNYDISKEDKEKIHEYEQNQDKGEISVPKSVGEFLDFLFPTVHANAAEVDAEHNYDNYQTPLDESINAYCEEIDRAKEANVDFSKTVYGNIDTDNRQKLYWTDENKERFGLAASSWGINTNQFGSQDYSTVLGMWDNFGQEGIPIAFTPMLQTENGTPELLNQNTVYDYIDNIVAGATEDGQINPLKLFDLDAQGMDIDGQHISNLIAGIGDDADLISQQMHFSGTSGSLFGIAQGIQEELDASGMSINDFLTEYGDKIPDELKKALTEAKVGEVGKDGFEVEMDVDQKKVEKKLKKLKKGETMEITADVEGVEQEIEAVIDEEGNIHYYTNINEVRTEVEPVVNEDGTVTYEPITDDLPKEMPPIDQDVNQQAVPDDSVTTPPDPVTQDVTRRIVNETKQANSDGAPKSTTVTANTKGADKVAALQGAISSVQGKQETVEAKAKGEPQVRNLASAIKTVQSKAVNVSASLTGTSAATFNALATSIKNLPLSKTSRVITKYVTKRVTELEGTAHSSGTAFAKGSLSDDQTNSIVRSNSWKTSKAMDALTGEVGQELVVTGNRWFTVGDNGAEFAHIPKGAVVFNAEQTEQLFSKGYINSRGKVNGQLRYPSSSATFLDGSIDDELDGLDEIDSLDAFLTGHAFGGLGGAKGSDPGSDSSNKSSSKSSTSKKSSNNKSSNNKSSKKKSSKKKGKSAWDKFEDWLSKFFDWMEIRLDRLGRKTEKWQDAAENAITLNGKVTRNLAGVKYTTDGMQNNTQKAIQATKKEYNASNKAEDLYFNQAKKVQKRALKLKKKGKPLFNKKKLKKAYKQLKQGKKVNIAEYGEKYRSVLEEMQNWIEKGLDQEQKTIDLQQQLADLYKQRFENIQTWYDTVRDFYSSQASSNESFINLRKATGEKLNRDAYKYQLSSLENTSSQSLKEYTAYLKEFNAQFAAGRLKKGTLPYYEAKAELEKLEQQYYDDKEAIASLRHEMDMLDLENLQKGIDLVSAVFERISNLSDAIKDIGDTNWNTQYDELQSYYKIEAERTKEEYDGILEKRESILKKMATVEVNSDSWIDFKEQLDSADSDLISVLTRLKTISDNNREMNWEPFNRGIETIKHYKDELNTLQDALNEDNFLADNGTFTNEGLANIALMLEQIELGQSIIANNREALKKLDEEYENGVISKKEWTDQTREFCDEIANESNSISNLKDNILDAYIDSLEKQNSLLQENIDKRKDALSKVKDYYDYQRTISEKSKDINYLQQQIAALDGVSNKAAQAKLASLREELAEAQLDMNDTVYEHEYDLRTEGLDSLSEDIDKALDRLIEELNRNNEKRDNLIENLATPIGENASSINNLLQGVISEQGLQLEITSASDLLGNTLISEQGIANLKTLSSDILSFAEFQKNSNLAGAAETLTQIASLDTKAIYDNIGGIAELYNEIINKTGNNTDYSDVGKEVTNTALPGTNEKTSSSNKSATKTTTKTTKTTSYTKEQKANYKTRIDGYLARNGKEYNKTTKYGEFNTALGKKTGFVLDEKHRKDLAKHLGTTEKDLYKFLQDIGYLPRKTTVSGKFAKGTKKVPKDMFGITQDAGQEVIYRKSDGAMLTPLGKGDKVFTAQMTDNLWKLAQNASLNNNGLSNLSAPIINNVNTSSPTININFENFMNVEGNVDENAITDIRKFKSEMVDEFTKTMTNEMNLLGHKFRF